MDKKWEEIKIDEILNYDKARTGRMSQYERIMQYRLTNSVSLLSEKLIGVMETIYNAHQGLKEKADELQKTYEDISQKQIESYKKISNSQNRLQKWIIILTCIIAISTVAYALITWESLSTMRESNKIQSKSVSVMSEANEIQRIFIELNTRPYLSIEPVKNKQTGFYFKADLVADTLRLEVDFIIVNKGDTPAMKIIPPVIIPHGGLTVARDASMKVPPEISLGPGDKQNITMGFNLGDK